MSHLSTVPFLPLARHGPFNIIYEALKVYAIHIRLLRCIVRKNQIKVIASKQLVESTENKEGAAKAIIPA